MEKVLIITYYWPPSGGAGVQRILKFTKYFSENFIKPYVITVKDDKASYPVIDETLIKDVPEDIEVFRTDTFEPYEIYSKLLGKNSIPTGFSNESDPGLFQKFSRFIRGNFFVPDARKGWVKFALRESKKLIKKENIKYVLTTSPPHSVQLVGLKLKEQFNIKWIADLRDPWTDIYYYNEFRHLPFSKNRDLSLEKRVLEQADRIITVGNSLKELFITKSQKIRSDKIFVIPNGYDSDDFINSSTNNSEKFIITYAGTLAESYNANIFFDSLKNIIETFTDIAIEMRLIGNIAASVVKYINNIGVDKNVKIIPTVSHEKSVEYLFESTVLLLVIPDVENSKGILTGKLFEYLASQKPIINIGPIDGDASYIIKECDSGRTFERSMTNELTGYIAELIRKWKEAKTLDINNNNFEKYSRRSQARELSQLILES